MAAEDETSQAAEPAGEPRRTFLERFIVGSMVVLFGTYAAAVLSYLAPAKKAAKGTGPVDAGPLDQIPVGQGKVVQADSGPVLVVNTETGVVALSAACTHLGCIVIWNAEKKQVDCPCHAGVFDLKGNVVSGPPPRSLPSVPVAVQNGHVMVGGAA